MNRKSYRCPLIECLDLDVECPVMAGSVLVEDSIIGSANQDIVGIDTGDNTFDFTWE